MLGVLHAPINFLEWTIFFEKRSEVLEPLEANSVKEANGNRAAHSDNT